MNSFILPVDKPAGPTSHDIVAVARRALGTRRIGHTGTLDPFASGLLLLCVENATRLAEYLTDLPKHYEAVARFDGATATDDATTDRISESSAWRSLDEATVRAAFEQQRGTIQQKPSAFSAKKVAGERAYAIARRGESVDLAPVEVTIYDIRIIALALPEVRFEVACSSGTYVRALARDVGAALGTGGYLAELRRTGIGDFDVAAAVTAGELGDAGRVRESAVPMLEAIRHFPIVMLESAEERAIRFGQTIERTAPPGIVVLTSGEQLIAIGASDGERIKPKKVLASD